MTALLAARRKHFAATLRFHARTESVGLGAAALPRLKCTLWQNYSPLTADELPARFCSGRSRVPCRAGQPESASFPAICSKHLSQLFAARALPLL